MTLTPSLSPRATGRLAAVFYILNILTGASALILPGVWSRMAILAASAAYVVVTLLFYALFRPLGVPLAALVAVPSLIGCGISMITSLGLADIPIDPLGFFGLYCLGLGFLILRSTFVPRPIGLFLLLGGLSWLTFFFPTLAGSLAPYNMAPGILAEVTLTVWLLVVGIDSQRWSQQANAAK